MRIFLPFPAPLPVAWRVSRLADKTAPPDRRADDADRWVRLARAGDQDAWRRLVERYRNPAYETALRIVRSREEAEEAAQDGFVRAWRALDGFRGEARFSTWLYRIVTRCALDAAVRTKKRRDRERLDPDRLDEMPAPAQPPVSDLLRLDRILDELSPVQRATVTLFYLRDRTVDETAAILEVPAGTVKTHLHRARRTLREAWLRQEGHDELPRL